MIFVIAGSIVIIILAIWLIYSLVVFDWQGTPIDKLASGDIIRLKNHYTSKYLTTCNSNLYTNKSKKSNLTVATAEGHPSDVASHWEVLLAKVGKKTLFALKSVKDQNYLYAALRWSFKPDEQVIFTTRIEEETITDNIIFQDLPKSEKSTTTQAWFEMFLPNPKNPTIGIQLYQYPHPRHFGMGIQLPGRSFGNAGICKNTINYRAPMTSVSQWSLEFVHK